MYIIYCGLDDFLHGFGTYLFSCSLNIEQITEYKSALHCISYSNIFSRKAFSADLNLLSTRFPIFKTNGSNETCSAILKFIA